MINLYYRNQGIRQITILCAPFKKMVLTNSSVETKLLVGCKLPESLLLQQPQKVCFYTLSYSGRSDEGRKIKKAKKEFDKGRIKKHEIKKTKTFMHKSVILHIHNY
jgi:hypothetical protein